MGTPEKNPHGQYDIDWYTDHAPKHIIGAQHFNALEDEDKTALFIALHHYASPQDKKRMITDDKWCADILEEAASSKNIKYLIDLGLEVVVKLMKVEISDEYDIPVPDPTRRPGVKVKPASEILDRLFSPKGVKRE